MVVRLTQWTLDVQDVDVMAPFWAEALGYRLDRGDDDDGAKLYPPVGAGPEWPSLWLQPSAGPKVGKNRNHPDLNLPGEGDPDAEADRLVALGARRVDVGQTGDEPFIVLADPEGNEFCVLRVSPRRNEPAGPAVLPEGTDCVLLDVDGTLVDSNYQHVVAWQRAFDGLGQTVAAWRIHRHIGMGGDQLVPAVAGQEFEDRRGEDARAAWRAEFDKLIDDVLPAEGATELVRALKDTGLAVVLASSGAADHVERYVDLLDVRDIVDAWTTSDDVDSTKPEPDLLGVARDRVGGRSPITVGDSTWDCEAAQRLGVVALGVRTGGFSADELLRAGARQVFDSLPELQRALP
jgi:phosphoglycolate phosphatase-like HAD superfamily hydrolase